MCRSMLASLLCSTLLPLKTCSSSSPSFPPPTGSLPITRVHAQGRNLVLAGVPIDA